MAGRLTVLDEDGLPAVWAVRDEGGNLEFRAIKMQTGGMMVLESPSPVMVAALQEVDADGAYSDRRRTAQIAEAHRLSMEMTLASTNAEELAEQLVAQGEVAEADRVARLEAEAEAQRLREELARLQQGDPKTTTTRRGKQQAAA